jgi:hypothetical protein
MEGESVGEMRDRRRETGHVIAVLAGAMATGFGSQHSYLVVI